MNTSFFLARNQNWPQMLSLSVSTAGVCVCVRVCMHARTRVKLGHNSSPAQAKNTKLGLKNNTAFLKSQLVCVCQCVCVSARECVCVENLDRKCMLALSRYLSILGLINLALQFPF